MNIKISFLVFMVSLPVFGRETKVQRAVYKDAFWALITDLGMLKTRCSTEIQCRLDAPSWIGQVQLKFSVIESRFPHKETVQAEFGFLKKLIADQGSADAIVSAAFKFERAMIEQLDLSPLPVMRSSFSEGQRLYTDYCSSCHGLTGEGNGILASRLQRSPSTLISPSRRKTSSPLVSYATMINGVDTTEMPTFVGTLSQDDMWNIALFIAALPYQKIDFGTCDLSLDLRTLVLISDDELVRTYAKSPDCTDLVGFARRVTSFSSHTSREIGFFSSENNARSSRALVIMLVSIISVSVGFIWLLRSRDGVE